MKIFPSFIIRRMVSKPRSRGGASNHSGLAPSTERSSSGLPSTIRISAYADLLLVDGNPVEDAALLVDYENNIDLVMKDGVIYKDTLDR